MKVITVDNFMTLGWKKNLRPLRGKAGVYMIFSRIDGRLQYVGKSANLSGRLSPSCHPVYREQLHDYYILEVPDELERRRVEARLIEVLHPPINQRSGIARMTEETRQSDYDSLFNV